jgi:hypothetical protein
MYPAQVRATVGCPGGGSGEDAAVIRVTQSAVGSCRTAQAQEPGDRRRI